MERGQYSEEKDWGIWTTKSRRPVGELNAAREVIVQAMDNGIQLRQTRCNITDSRKDRWTNADALEDLIPRFPQVLSFLAGVNGKCFGSSVSLEVSPNDAFVLSKICFSMPDYLIGHKVYGYQGELPDLIGDMFKINAGLHVGFLYYDIADETANLPVNSKKMYELLNEHNMLSNEERVCPAPPSMIRRTIEALVYRQGAVPDVAAVDELFPDFIDLALFSRDLVANEQAAKHMTEFIGKIGKK